MDKYKAKRIPIKDVLAELEWVPFPPKENGEECGCKIIEGCLLLCKQHQPIPL